MRTRIKYLCFSALFIYFIMTPYAGSVFAADVTLTWDAPTENTDNTPLTDLAGFNVHYGTQSRGSAVSRSEFSYESMESAGNVTNYQVNNLTDGLTYYFAVTAYNSLGNESVYSDEISITLPPLSPVPDIVVTDSVSPAGDLQIPFGDVTVGSPLQQIVTVANTGNAGLTIGIIAVSNPVSFPFSIMNDNCSGRIISPSSNCTLTVRFDPSSTGSYNDSFDIPSDDPDEDPVTFSVNGTGLTVPVPDIVVTDSVSPAGDLRIPFGDVTVGSPLQQIVTITNTGNAGLTIGIIAVSNPVSFPFSIMNDNCSGRTISPSSNCTLTVRFAPSSTGSYNDSFDIPSDDPDEGRITLSMSGNGLPVPVPDITVTDSVTPANDFQIAFGDVTVENSSQHSVTVTNNGNADLAIGMIANSNPVSLPFSIMNDNCSGRTISPSSNCTLTVRFAPSSIGSYNDSFDIPSDDPDEGRITLRISGNGLPVPVADIEVIDSASPGGDLQLPFGDITEGLSQQHTVTITNNGNANLTIGTIAQNNPVALPFRVQSDNCSGQTVMPSSNCTLTINFLPLAAGLFNDSFDIPSDDPDENPVIVMVSGTGLASVVNNSPSDPELVYPAHGQRGLGRKVGLRWKKSKDPDGDVVTYDLYLCTNDSLTTNCMTGTDIIALSHTDIYYAGIGMYGTGFLLIAMIITLTYGLKSKGRPLLQFVAVCVITLIFISCGGGGSGDVSGAVISSGETEAEINYPVDLESGITYYWKVVAKDGNGGEASSEVRSFETL